ncbi:MAG TPA: tRNA (adenosine(37)-N6)-dimethylallyltransferase MiaA [Candidatus Limnocylindrales bacterium]|nr:tRNA (adenosine(37)-N6)-dimethylallyltransferase MiaA [Candidatus Limnocylindrales bacterium]
MTGSPPLLVVAGPTATGKTALAIDVALALGGDGIPAEVISADSRQVYRGLDIGTAKPTLEERRGVAHHGLDLVDPDAPFSVADFVDHVALVLPAIAARGGLAILAGGTGFWLRAIARGLDTAALPSDADVRRRVEAELATAGIAAAAGRLATLAPTLAAGIDTRNPRRVARALEIAELVGDRPLPPPLGYDGPVAWLGLDVPRPLHDRWIADRARAQFDAGLVEEARALRTRFDPSLPAFSAIGYAESWALLDGEIDRETAIERDAARNVAFAKRQRTWFRREPGIEWLDPSAGDLLRRAIEVAAGLMSAR